MRGVAKLGFVELSTRYTKRTISARANIPMARRTDDFPFVNVALSILCKFFLVQEGVVSVAGVGLPARVTKCLDGQILNA